MSDDLEKQKHTTHALTPEQVIGFSNDEWLRIVREMAYPQRADSMELLNELAIERKARNIVETGTIRGWGGDGQSTLIFSGLALRLSGSLWSVDNNQIHIENAKRWIGQLNTPNISWITEDSVKYLSSFLFGAIMEFTIDILYLDSYDYDFNDPIPAQIHNLAEMGAAYGKLGNESIIAIDDANLAGGGKGLLTTRFLLERGWKVIYEGYQRIFIRP